jgi:phosphomannomutase
VRDLSDVVKAYDVRGVVPDQLDAALARDVGAAFVRVAAADRVVVGHDMRPSSAELVDAFVDGASGQGADVVRIGLASTDQLYFASGHLDCAGAMFTASHNPARYNGIKLCRAGAAPVGRDTGLAEIRRLVETGSVPAPSGRRGRVTDQDLLAAYAGHLRSLVDLAGIRPLTVVVDAGNGMAGHTVPAVLDGRCTSSWTAPSRTTRPTRSSRRTCGTCRPRSAGTRPTSAWPSTVTPTGAFSSTSAARRSRRRR